MKRNNLFLLFTKGSIALNVFFALYKIALAFFSHSILIFIYAFYNVGNVITKTTILKNFNKNNEKYYLVGLIVLISSICFIANSVKMMINGNSYKYNMYIAILIAAVTFFEIGMSAYGIYRSKKRNDIKTESIKLTNLASALISLNLTQIALLSFTTNIDVSFYNGISGIILGFISSMIGLYMIFHIKNNLEFE